MSAGTKEGTAAPADRPPECKLEGRERRSVYTAFLKVMSALDELPCASHGAGGSMCSMHEAVVKVTGPLVAALAGGNTVVVEEMLALDKSAHAQDRMTNRLKRIAAKLAEGSNGHRKQT